MPPSRSRPSRSHTVLDHEREPAYQLARKLLDFTARQRWPAGYSAYLRTNALKAANRVAANVAEGIGKGSRNSVLNARGELAELGYALDTGRFRGQWRALSEDLFCELDALIVRFDDLRDEGPYLPPPGEGCGVSVAARPRARRG
jgi:hypothetical protein